MDSPSDLSPNAPPAGFDDPFKNIPENLNASQQGTASTEGSVDSSGFEKVEHDVLEEYGQNFAQQMQQSIFGQLPDDPDGHEDDFVIVPSKSLVKKMEDELKGVEPLHRIPAEIDKPYPANVVDEISPRHLSNQKETTPESHKESSPPPKEPTPSPRESTPSPVIESKEASPVPISQPEHHEHAPSDHSRESSIPLDHHESEEAKEPERENHSPSQEPKRSPTPIQRSSLPPQHSPSPVQRSPSPERCSPTSSPVNTQEERFHVDHHEPMESVIGQHVRESTPLSEEETFPEHPVPPEEMEKEQHLAMDDKPHSHSDDHFHGHSSEDLIDIPRNESPVQELDYGSHHHDQPGSDSPLIPETHHTFHHEEKDLPFPHHDDHTEPVYDFETHQNRFTDDLLDIGQQARELVDEAVQEAGDKIHNAEHVAMDTAHHVEDEVQHQVDSIHHVVDDVLEQMNETDDFQEAVKAQTKESDDEGVPDFRSTPEPEERPHERNGPLTIPEIPDQQEEETNFLDEHQVHHHEGHRHGFETEPRPPTPPKDISDEDVKPSLVNLGHGHVAHSHADSHHSILKHNVEPWFDFKHVDPCVLDLVYWRDPKKSAIALSLSLLAVFVLAKYPLLSILSYTGLAVLAGTLGFRVFKAVEGQIKKTGGENPFQDYLNKDLNVPQDKVHAQVDVLAEHAVCLANKAKKLIFVENIFESVKFVLLLWSLTYVSAWFSGFGLIILTILGIFTIPKVYETYQEPIDQQLAVISGHINNVIQLVEEKVPFLKRATTEAEKKDQ